MPKKKTETPPESETPIADDAAPIAGAETPTDDAPPLDAALSDAKAALAGGDDGDADDASDDDASDDPPRRRKPGRKPKYATEEERHAAKIQRDRDRRARLAGKENTDDAGDVAATVKGTRATLAARVIELEGQLETANAKLARDLPGARAMLTNMIAQTAHALSRMVAARRGSHWAMTREEAQEIGGAWALPLSAHWGKIEEYSPWVGAIVVTGSFVVLRAQVDAGAISVAELKERTGIVIPPPPAETPTGDNAPLAIVRDDDGDAPTETGRTEQ